MFGLRPAKARGDLPPDGRWRDLREAAMMQHVVVQSVRTLMAHQGLNQSELADVTKIPRRTLVRILSGETWVQTHHLVSLGRVLGTSLYAVPRLEDLTFDTTWVGMPARSGPETVNQAD